MTHDRAHPRLTLALSAPLAALLILAGCGGDASRPEIKAAQAKVPFQIVLPTYIPDNFRFSGVDVSTPPEPNGPYRVILYYTQERSDTGSFAASTVPTITVDESNFRNEIGERPLQAIQLTAEVSGQAYQGTNANGEAIAEVSFWTGKVGIIVSGLEVPLAQLKQVAASMLKTT